MIEINNISVSYGGEAVLKNCSLTVAAGEHAALMGPSGCGKTTLLRCAAGLIKPERGSVAVTGRIGMVFQEPRLFPWLTAEENIAQVIPHAAGSAVQWLERAGLSAAAGKYPSQLSGGMCQRVSICRALAFNGDVLLLDEPFKGMDAPLRRYMAGLISECSRGRTVLLVTHDPVDAEELADTVYDYRDMSFVRRDGEQ